VLVPSYEHFARFYDELHRDDPLGNIERVRGYLARYAPAARAVLELGCGSGAILAELDGGMLMTGIDRSPAMLDRARARAPDARLVEADIATFDLGTRFDAVLCLFDTLNHLERFDAWRSLFERTADHLNDGGLFAFDVNTVGSLRRLAEAAAWDVELSDAIVTQWVGPGRNGCWVWHVQIREPDGGVLEERIIELAVELDRLEDALCARFEVLESTDGSGAPPSDDSRRAFYACRRLP
jgi:SAM-dependent methyltransferase